MKELVDGWIILFPDSMAVHLKRWILGLLGACLLGAGLLFALYWFHRPPAMERTEIFRGVYLTVKDLPGSSDGGGKVMIVEIHWNEPGVQLKHRDFDYTFSRDNPLAAHYNLEFADWAVLREKPAVLVNTTRYFPEGLLDSLPGKRVRTLETLVVDGQVSHLHEHTYLLFWDQDMEATVQRTKPPSSENLSRAVLGIGLQGIQINEGSISMNAIAETTETYARTFIGIDPIQDILYLLAFEKASPRMMLSLARDAGIIFGGQVDSGDATNLIVGPGAQGIRPFSGIRNPRPLGPYLKVFADRLPSPSETGR